MTTFSSSLQSILKFSDSNNFFPNGALPDCERARAQLPRRHETIKLPRLYEQIFPAPSNKRLALLSPRLAPITGPIMPNRTRNRFIHTYTQSQTIERTSQFRRPIELSPRERHKSRSPFINEADKTRPRRPLIRENFAPRACTRAANHE